MKRILWFIAVIGLFVCSARDARAQNPHPCTNVTNTATTGQVLSAASPGNTPPCTWINAAPSSAVAVLCSPTSNSSTTYTCSPTPALTSYTPGQMVTFTPDVSCAAGGITLNISGLGAKPVVQFDLNTPATLADCTQGNARLLIYTGLNFAFLAPGNYVASIGTQLSDRQFDTTSQLLPTWRLALANVRNNTAGVIKRLLFIGDSTTWGTGCSATTNVTTCSPPTKLAALLNSWLGGGVAIGSLATAPIAGNVANDNRWTVGANWTAGGFGANAWVGAGNTGNLVFTPSPQVTIDTFIVWWLGNNGGANPLNPGTMTFVCGAGAPVVVNGNTQASQSVFHSTVTCPAAGVTNAVTISSAGAGTNSYIIGVEPYLSTSANLLVDNMGYAGDSSQSFSHNSGWGALDFIEKLAPDASIISLGINDAGSSVPASTFQTAMQAIITSVQISGDAILTDYPPSTGVPYTTFEPLYLPVLTTLGTIKGAKYVSIWNRWNGVVQAALMNGGSGLHPNNFGYLDITQLWFSTLTRQ